MPEYEVRIEATSAGDLENDADLLIDSFNTELPELEATVGVSEASHAILVVWRMDGNDGLEVHEQALATWRERWESVFEDAPPAALAVRVAAATTPRPVPADAGDATLLDDAEADLEAELAAEEV